MLKVESQAGCGIHRTCFLLIGRIRNGFYRKDSRKQNEDTTHSSTECSARVELHSVTSERQPS